MFTGVHSGLLRGSVVCLSILYYSVIIKFGDPQNFVKQCVVSYLLCLVLNFFVKTEFLIFNDTDMSLRDQKSFKCLLLRHELKRQFIMTGLN